ncbi:uncharacterized protein LOC131226968 [Magnolia sinica]|uniref:uncharacterized protein LOC131226968 n=1 Tax=Magnolia sinica TaxID=86752 RepID=UPI00265868CE|nr:uncharacterized protein LOC131226968 [Magnolia sinica]
MSSNEVVTRVECGCCGMWEECTIGYIGWVKEQFGGTWVCGLCEEAIKDKQVRLGVGIEAALRLHATFMEATNIDPTVQIVRSMIELLKKFMSSNSSKETIINSL